MASQQFRHSNFGYALQLLARVIEAVNEHGLSYEQFVQQQVFAKCGFEGAIECPAHAGMGYYLTTWDEGQWVVQDAAFQSNKVARMDSSAGWWLSAVEVTKFCQALKDCTLLDEAMQAELLRPLNGVHSSYAKGCHSAEGSMWNNGALGATASVMAHSSKLGVSGTLIANSHTKEYMHGIPGLTEFVWVCMDVVSSIAY